MLVRHRFRRVFAMAYVRIRNASDAEDIAQETFVRAYQLRSAHEFGHRGFDAHTSWLFTSRPSKWTDTPIRTNRTFSLSVSELKYGPQVSRVPDAPVCGLFLGLGRPYRAELREGRRARAETCAGNPFAATS